MSSTPSTKVARSCEARSKSSSKNKKNIDNNSNRSCEKRKRPFVDPKVPNLTLDDTLRLSHSVIFAENTIPLSILLKQKHDVHGLADLRPNSSMNPTYQAHFEALLVTDHNQQQHPSDKAAVVKYIRRRERRKRAEENKKNYQLSDDTLEQVCLSLDFRLRGAHR